MYAKITQTAQSLPAHYLSNDDLSKIMPTNDEWITTRTGIKQRRVVTEQSTTDLCVDVALKLIQKRSFAAETLDFIIVATMTPDFQTPSVASCVQGAIGATNTLAFDLNAACSGFIYALSMAEKLIRTGSKCGLVIGGETMSKLVDWQDRRTAVLFGDGAAGVLIENTATEPLFIKEILASDGTKSTALQAPSLANNSPFFKGANSTRPFIEMDGRAIFDFATRNVSKTMLELLEVTQTDVEAIDWVIAHQANARLLSAMAKKTGIRQEKFLSNIANVGNTSSASIPLVLDDYVSNGTIPLDGTHLTLLTGFGGGLTWGSMLVRL